MNVAPSTALDDEVALVEGRDVADGRLAEPDGRPDVDDGRAVTVTVVPPVSRWLDEAQPLSAPAVRISPAQTTTVRCGT